MTTALHESIPCKGTIVGSVQPLHELCASSQLEAERSSNASLKEQLFQLQREYGDASQFSKGKEQELTSTLKAGLLCTNYTLYSLTYTLALCDM